MKRFILLTTGRAGSTALMDVLAEHEDIIVPNKQIDCRDNELLNPDHVRQYLAQYQRLSGSPIGDELSLLRAFYRVSAGAGFAGFKSMPNRHRHLRELLEQDNPQVITLIRGNLAATVASFIVAIDAGTWRREGGRQTYRFAFGPRHEARVRGHIDYIRRSAAQLRALPNAIHLRFEDLCQAGYANQALDQYFQRPIRLPNPQPPLSGAEYVDNWEEFTRFIAQYLKESGRQRAPG